MAHHSVEITDANFEEVVLNSKTPVLVDFWAPWCGPCLAMGPAIEELAQEYEGKAIIGKLNVDDNARMATEYRITSIPALIFFKDGKVADKHVGSTTKGVLKGKLDTIMS